MKIPLLLILLTTVSATLQAQNGYVKFTRNHVVQGFVRIHNEGKVHEHQIEIATSKDDPAPKRYHKKDVVEYAIQDDTFRILKKFFPYDVEEIYYEIIDAKVIQSGDVSLLQIHNSHSTLDKGLFATVHDQNPTQIPYFYVLQDKEGNYTRGVPSKKDKYKLVLQEFFSEEELLAYEKAHGTIHFKDLEKLVRYCNSQPD